jgi:hypothetical protein
MPLSRRCAGNCRINEIEHLDLTPHPGFELAQTRRSRCGPHVPNSGFTSSVSAAFHYRSLEHAASSVLGHTFVLAHTRPPPATSAHPPETHGKGVTHPSGSHRSSGTTPRTSIRPPTRPSSSLIRSRTGAGRFESTSKLLQRLYNLDPLLGREIAGRLIELQSRLNQMLCEEVSYEDGFKIYYEVIGFTEAVLRDMRVQIHRQY